MAGSGEQQNSAAALSSCFGISVCADVSTSFSLDLLEFIWKLEAVEQLTGTMLSSKGFGLVCFLN